MGIITAHSGCDGTQDNSLEFIEYALSAGADCLEVDVRRNQAGDLFLAHDETGEERVKLCEAFALVKSFPEKKINCDLKMKDLEIPVYRLAREFKAECQLIYSGEVSIKLLREKDKEFPEAEIYLNVENLFPEVYCEAPGAHGQEKLKDMLAQAKGCPISCINMEYHLFTDEIIDLLALIKLRGSAWTVDEPEEARRLMEKDIFNITTRNLKKAMELRKEMRR
ncbi:glycerophosphodiester phosphodiesterase [Lachnospiraceae bacterium 54-53]